METQYIKLSFTDELVLMKSLKKLKSENIKIGEVYTPFPVHGLDKILDYKKSRIPTIGFIAGAIGAIFGLWFQIWVQTEAYPINFGGKPLLALPSFIPVTFELAILFTGLAMVGALLYSCNLKPNSKNKVIDIKATDNTFVALIDTEQANVSTESIGNILSDVKEFQLSTL